MNGNYSKVFKLGATVFLAGCLSMVCYTSLKDKDSAQPVNDVPTITCAYPDKSFCTTENTIKKYVAAGNYSNILENQGPANGDIYQVQQNGVLQLMTRNNYINFFREYAAVHGPFNFVGESTQDGGIVMSFNGKSGADSYDLLFKKTDSTWRLVYPIVRQ